MKKTKIAPSTKHGFQHWLMQRVSAVALIPLVIWLVLSFVNIGLDPQGYLPVFFSYPLNAFMGILFFCFSFYHGSLGLRVIIEDYITNKAKVHFYVMLVNFISITTAVAVCIAILKLHITN
jgi:succinate dehydrogenase / fumarate reductase membrane anchor subunit